MFDAMIVTWKRPAKHNMNLNQTHFRWTSRDRWRSKKWFEKGGRQRRFSAGRYLKTRDYMWYYHYLSASNNSGRTVNARQRFSNKCLNYFNIAHFCEDNQIHFEIDDFAHPVFSTPCACIPYFFIAGFLLDVRPIPRYRCAALMKECCALGVAKRGRKSVWFMKP